MRTVILEGSELLPCLVLDLAFHSFPFVSSRTVLLFCQDPLPFLPGGGKETAVVCSKYADPFPNNNNNNNLTTMVAKEFRNFDGEEGFSILGKKAVFFCMKFLLP